jgi:hypothetical protein
MREVTQKRWSASRLNPIALGVGLTSISRINFRIEERLKNWDRLTKNGVQVIRKAAPKDFSFGTRTLIFVNTFACM